MFSRTHLREFSYQLCRIEKKILFKPYSTKLCSN